MRIAVTYDNGRIFQHFGNTEFFKLYDVEDGVIKSFSVVPTLGQGHGALASFLSANKVDKVICGGIGGGAKNALSQQGIEICGGVSGSCDEAVIALLSGRLSFTDEATCSHHDHGEGHDCSDHDCGGSCH